mmetsp:Transcript_50150/g.156964  ORF Transcript_50150/g.156964 Transcript_50150/m.156964 type:complete len:274 (+) Transcript_50150:423-1244(+)
MQTMARVIRPLHPRPMARLATTSAGPMKTVGPQELHAAAAAGRVDHHQAGDRAQAHDGVPEDVDLDGVLETRTLEERRGVAQEGVDARELLGHLQVARDEHPLTEVAVPADLSVRHLGRLALLREPGVNLAGLGGNVPMADLAQHGDAGLVALLLHDVARRLRGEPDRARHKQPRDARQQHAEAPVLPEQRHDRGRESAHDNVDLEEAAHRATDPWRSNLRVVEGQGEAADPDAEAGEEAAHHEDGHAAEGEEGDHDTGQAGRAQAPPGPRRW